MNDILLEANQINKHFYQPVPFHVLKDISFQLRKGEFVSIMGKSGCGKSTLLYILSTMDTAYKGQLFLNDRLVTGESPLRLSQIRNEYIGFVFQFHYLLPEFSVLDNVMLPALKLRKKSKSAIRKAAQDKLDMLNIGHLTKQQANRISGGEKQRVAIARALINDPLIIMGDEPTGNLDSENSDNVFNIFKSLANQGELALLIVTHDNDFAEKTDRTILMEDGRIIEQ